MTSSQSVTFRHGSNVEFSESGFPGASAPGGSDMAPIEGYNLQTVNANKARDFANPMYDAVQSGTTSDPGMSNGSGECTLQCNFFFFFTHVSHVLVSRVSGIYDVPQEPSKSKAMGHSGSFTEPASAIIAPSSITHKSSPQLQLRTRELDPSADTGKDTQFLVEEDKSEC